MKKLFSFIMVALMSIMTLNAETTRIYCKMAQNWWKVDNAAVGCHSWGTPGPGTTWPGVRMTPVEGETDMWYIDLDVTKVQNVIFTRVNPSGNIADWGAKTGDLVIPTNGDNLYTITKSSSCWSGNDCTCDGTWSKYTAPVVTEPTVTGINITGDKYVGTELTFTATVAGFSAEPMVIYEVKAKGGEYKQAQGGKFTPEAAGDYTVKATAFYQPEEGEVEEASKEVAFTVTEAPVKEYYLVGDFCGWNFDTTAIKTFEPYKDDTLFVKVDSLYGEIKVTEGKGWDKSFGAWNEVYQLRAGASPYGMKEGNESQNFSFDADYKNAIFQLYWADKEGQEGVKELMLHFVSGEKVEQPVTYYAKNNWNGAAADDWSWLEMSATNQENVYMLDSVVFGGTGVNINTKEDDTDALWFAADKIVVLDGLDGFPAPIPPDPRKRDTLLYAPARMGAVLEAPTLLAGDTIKLFFNAVDSTLSAAIVGRPAPAARKEFVFVAGEAAEANPALFAITWGKDGSNETVKLANKADDIYTAEILETVDSVVLVRCASDATEIIWDGEGKNVWNQTANYELCDTMYFESWVEETNLFAVTCEAPKPVETKYYAKNNWNGAASEDWSWLEMTKEEDLYVLDSVVFGGTGVNINTKEDDTDAIWFDLKKMKYNEQDTIQALDTVRFELAISKEDTVLTAIKLGRPAPAARKEFVFVAGEAAEANPALFAITWGKDGSNETVKLANKADDIYTAEILETVDSVVLVRCATGATEIIWDGEGKNVWNQTANYALCDTMYFESWVEETNLFTITCDTPKPVGEKYYITGNAALVGEEKAWSAQAIEMTDGAYTFTALPAGEYEMKITNGAWEPEGQSWGSAALSEECSAGVGDKEGNIHFIVETPNDVNVAIAEGKVTVIGTFKEEPVGTGITVNVTVPVGTPACYFYGEMSGNLFAEMTKLDDTHYTITFPHATSIGWGYLFVWENGNWNTKNADPEGDITVEPVEGVIDIEIKAWVTNPGTEYKYTTYTEWQVKFGPAWEWVDMTKQEEGVFAVNAVWGTTTGMNIASGENPIKQDWYPLGDAALTIAEDVAEGDNVVITLTVVDDETVALNVVKGEGPTPEEGFGIIVNGTEKIKGQKNEEQVEFLEYMIEANLTAGATFQLYDFANDAPWTEANIDEASTKNVTINANNLYEVAADGKYTIYLKMFGLGNNQVYIAFTSGPTGLIEIMHNAKDGKFIINGNMIIRRNGALYTIQGARL